MQKYTIKDFNKEFPDDKACLEWLKNNRWPDGIHCMKCDSITSHHMIAKRRAYACQDCGTHVYPCATTIFHKSPTPLTCWFHAAFLMATTRCGVSAKHVEREIGVTYKTAWRMCHLIRERLNEGKHPLSGDVEVDESYFGGKAKWMHKDKREQRIQGRGASGKTAVFGMIERGGCVVAHVVPDTKACTLIEHVTATVQTGSNISSDEFPVYDALTSNGYQHGVVLHKQGQYVNEVDGYEWHTQNMDGFWD